MKAAQEVQMSVSTLKQIKAFYGEYVILLTGLYIIISVMYTQSYFYFDIPRFGH